MNIESMFLNGVTVAKIRKRGKTWHPSENIHTLSKKKKLLINLAIRDGMNCVYCDRLLEFEWMGDFKNDEVVSFEHITPESQGGPLSAINGWIACRPCNENRGDQPVEVFLKKMSEGHYVIDEVLFRRAERKMKRALQGNGPGNVAYRVRVKKKKRKARKEAVANVWKGVYNFFHPVLADAELG